jgi:hypothetical protein
MGWCLIRNRETYLITFTQFSFIQVQATWSSETSVDFQRTKRRYIQEDKVFSVDVGYTLLPPSALYTIVMGFRAKSGFAKLSILLFQIMQNTS